MTGSSVTVRENEHAIIETGYAKGWLHAAPPPARTGKSVAVIGSGPEMCIRDRPYPARLPLAGRGARFAGKVQSDGRHDTGAGPESDFGRRMNPFHLIIKPHKMRCDCAFTFGATVA